MGVVFKMKQMKILGVVLIAVFVFAAVTGATASAAKPEFLTPNGEQTKFTDSSGEIIFEDTSGKELKCKKSTSKGQILKAKEGSYTFDLEECSSGGVQCNTEGDAAGVILFSGTFDLAYILKPPTTHTGLILLFNQFTIKCAALSVAVRMHGANGGLIVLIEPVNLLTDEFTINASEVKGVQAETAYWLSAESAETKEVFIESRLGANFLQTGVDMVNEKIKTEKEIKIDA
jgi:hypothetical protein